MDNNTQIILGTWDSINIDYGRAMFFGNDLMLPAGGGRYYGSGSIGYREHGYYWSSSKHTSHNSWYLMFFDGGYANTYYADRNNEGFLVRCVADSPQSQPVDLTLGKTTVSLIVGGSDTVSISGGNENYTVIPSNNQVATAVISGTNVVITGLLSGTMTITLEDSSGATASIMVSVSSTSSPSGKCGAYVAPGAWKEFDCYNLAAIGKTTNDDPFTPSCRLIGGYWQWGRKGPDSSQWYDTNTEHFAHGPTGPGVEGANEILISSWDQTDVSDGSWSDYTKTFNDPCSEGFRIPTISQWVGILDNNTQTTLGTWPAGADNHAIYNSARFFGNALMLPANGSRGSMGSLYYRDHFGYYWASTGYTANYAMGLSLGSGSAKTYHYDRKYGFSVRCIKE